MKHIEKALSFADFFCKYLAAACLASMVLAIVLQVSTRWLMIPMAWTVEISQYLFIWLTFIASYIAARKAQQIRVDVFVNWLPPLVGSLLTRLANLLTAAYFFVVLYLCVTAWPKLTLQKSPVLKIPMAFIYMGIIIGSFLMFIYYFAIVFLKRPVKKEG